MKHKKVELTELFYDLVYVYAISQVTSLIHHVHHGFVTPSAFFTFAMGLIIYVNSWMVQSVYTNRFGKNSLTNILMMFFQMVCLMMSSTAITGDWSRDFIWFILPMAGISLLLLGQYVLSFYQTKNLADKRLSHQTILLHLGHPLCYVTPLSLPPLSKWSAGGNYWDFADLVTASLSGKSTNVCH